MADFVGYRDNRNNATVRRAMTAQEDAYEALAKGIGYYNGNGRVHENADGTQTNALLFTRRSWPRLLLEMEYDADSTENSVTVCHSCRYSTEIRNAENVLAGHLRSYVWRGGVYPLVSPNGAQHPNAGQQWCIGYGEAEWLSGVSFTGATSQTRRVVNGNPREGDRSYVTNCN
jgi:hypothetical protein